VPEFDLTGDIEDVEDVDTPAVGIPTLSGWLRENDVIELAAVARDARLLGASFGRRLRGHA
jgi:hypothetical protein